MKKLLVVLALLFGCDSSAVLANIDTYTCAYLPGVIDCTTQEVHDKAVSILENGLVEAEMTCYIQIPYQKVEYVGPQPFYTILSGMYTATAFHDGAVFTSCQAGGPINYYDQQWAAGNLQHYSGSRFSARSSQGNVRRTCDIQLFTMEVTPFYFEAYDGVLHVQKAYLYDSPTHEQYDISEYCDGFNLEYFE